MILVLVPWLLLVALFVRSFKATSSIKTIRGMYWVGLGVFLGGDARPGGAVRFSAFSMSWRPESFSTSSSARSVPVRSAWLATWVVSLLVIFGQLSVRVDAIRAGRDPRRADQLLDGGLGDGRLSQNRGTRDLTAPKAAIVIDSGTRDLSPPSDLPKNRVAPLRRRLHPRFPPRHPTQTAVVTPPFLRQAESWSSGVVRAAR